MCEQFVARSERPFPIDEPVPVGRAPRALRDRRLRLGRGVDRGAGPPRDVPRRPCLPRRPERRTAIGRIETTSLLIHLRRPSRLSTLTLADTQPFADPAGRFAFSHNGDLRNYHAQRDGLPRPQAGSTAGPTPRSGPAGSRTPGGRTCPSPTSSAASTGPSAGQANLAVLAGDGSGLSLRRQRGEPGLPLPPRRDRDRLDRDLLARSVALPAGRRRRAETGSRVELGRDRRPGLRSAGRDSRGRGRPGSRAWLAGGRRPDRRVQRRSEPPVARAQPAVEDRRPGPRIEPGQGSRAAPEPGDVRPTAGRGSRAGSAAARTRTGPGAG